MKVSTNLILILILALTLVVCGVSFLGFKKYRDLNNKLNDYTSVFSEKIYNLSAPHQTHTYSHTRSQDEPVEVVVVPEEEREQMQEDDEMKSFMNSLEQESESIPEPSFVETIDRDVVLKQDLEPIQEVEQELEQESDMETEVVEEEVQELSETDEEEIDLTDEEDNGSLSLDSDLDEEVEVEDISDMVFEQDKEDDDEDDLVFE